MHPRPHLLFFCVLFLLCMAPFSCASEPAASTPTTAGCLPGQLTCATGCVDPLTDSGNCGACGAVCQPGTSCVNGACACPGGLTSCSGACVDASTNAAHCGGCGVVCQGTQACTGGLCQCQAGYTACSMGCVDALTNPANCGACDVACAAGLVCSQGICAASCAAGETNCNGACILDLTTNRENCGACGVACPSDQACVGGACSCAAGSTNCNGVCVNTTADPQNCGGCGTVCAGGQQCSSSVCACPAGQELCNGSCAVPPCSNGTTTSGVGGGSTTGSTDGASSTMGGASSTDGATSTTDASTTTTSAGGTGTGGTGTGTGGFSVEAHLASDEGSHLTTVGVVTWSLEGATVSDARIEFGADTNYGMEAPVDLSAEGYRTLLLGLKGNTTYNFRIVANGGANVSENFTVTTGAVPGNVANFSFSSQAGSEPGFLVLGSWQGSSTAFIIDSDGDVVWWYNSPAQNIGRARMSADGKNMWMVAASNQGNPLYRISMDGLDTQTYNGIEADHDVTAVTGETMAFLDYGGTCDRIFEITPAGNPTMVFDSTGQVSQPCHGNSLRYSAAEDVYVFSEHQQDVLVVNRNGSVSFRLTEVVGANSNWGGEQHGTHLLDDTFLVFANRGAGNTSAVIEYSRSNWSVVNTFDTGLSTPNMGDVQRLPGGNTLITYSNAGEIREVDSGGNPVLSISRTGANFSYTMWRASLYGPSPDLGM